MCAFFKKLITRLPRRALSNIDLLNYTHDIPYFRGVYMRDTLPSKSNGIECAILNLDTSQNPGTHWVAYCKINNYCEYFDSYGDLKPPKELIMYLTKSTNIYYNYINYQKNNSHNCGHLCIKFLKRFWHQYLN